MCPVTSALLTVHQLAAGQTKKGRGGQGKDQLIPALSYADDMVMFAGDEETLKRALVVLGKWCEKWSVKGKRR